VRAVSEWDDAFCEDCCYTCVEGGEVEECSEFCGCDCSGYVTVLAPIDEEAEEEPRMWEEYGRRCSAWSKLREVVRVGNGVRGL
jgi:hypothetical protein